jgi:TetR/AcrR family transcriptional repressor of bet genes
MKKINLRSENKKNSNLKLISSAIKNISQKGIKETTMLDVSQGAGLSQGIVNFHFKSKELLLIETLKFVSNEYLESFQKCLVKSGSDPKKILLQLLTMISAKKYVVVIKLPCGLLFLVK